MALTQATFPMYAAKSRADLPFMSIMKELKIDRQRDMGEGEIKETGRETGN